MAHMAKAQRIAFLAALVFSLLRGVAMADGTLSLPAELTTIEAEAFYGTTAEIIVVPEGVTSIGSRAFGGSSVKEIRVSASADLRIADDALEGSPDAHFVSSDAKWDGVYKYSANSSGVTVKKYMGMQTGALTIPSELGGKTVTVIGEGFLRERTDFTKVVIPEGVTFIEKHAFKDCANLTDITFPSTLVDYYATSFDGCGSNAVETFYFRLPDNITTTLYGDAETHSCFTNCNALVECKPGSTTAYHMGGNCYITFPGLHDYRFRYIGNDHVLNLMKYVGSGEAAEIPSNVELARIYANAFEGSTSLKKVVIPEGVTMIEAKAFKDCVNLTDITFPDSLTQYYANSFDGCGSSATEIFYFSLPDNITTTLYGDAETHSCFTNCNAVVECRPGSTTAYHMGGNCYITFPGLHDYRFDYVGNNNVLWLTAYVGHDAEITLPHDDQIQIQGLKEGLFKDCEFLTKIVIPEGVRDIEASVFENCYYLAEVTLPSTIQAIRGKAFRYAGAYAEAEEGKALVLRLPGDVSALTGYGDATETETSISNGTFKHCGLHLIADLGTTTANQLRATHYNFYDSYDTETGTLGNYVRWDDD